MLSSMTIELALLAASVVLGVVHIIVASHLQSWQRGYWWTASSREQSVTPLSGIAGRAERALRNYLETFSLLCRCNSCRHRDEHAQLAHRMGSPLLLLGSHRLRTPVYGALAVSSFAHVEHPDDRDPDKCCRAVPLLDLTISPSLLARADEVIE
jgi:hypothetical protein